MNIMTVLFLASAVLGSATVIDGDSLYVNGVHIRLQGLDAPEMDSPAGHESKAMMESLVKNKTIRCDLTGDMSYDRHIATCYVDGVDLTAAMIRLNAGRPYCRFIGERYNDDAIAAGQRPCTRFHPQRPPRQ